MKKIIECPHCQANLIKTGIYQVQTCEVKWRYVYMPKYESFEMTDKVALEPDIIHGGDYVWFCKSCDEELSEQDIEGE